MAELISPDVAPPARWLTEGLRQPGAAEFCAGAALALLDPLARSADPVMLLWRRRLALRAAAIIAALEGRREDEAGLRDLLMLARPGEDPGPGGRLLGGWRHLAEPLRRAASWPERLPAAFDLPPAPAGELLRAAARPMPGTLPIAGAAALAEQALAQGPAYRGLALWLGDAALARALGWERPVPLLALHLPRAAFRARGDEWAGACALAFAKGALSAVTLYSELAPKAAALRRAAPKLRGKDAAAAVAQLLCEDAMSAQAGERASDRAARRLFERLTGLGLVRELSGRASFRLYGL